uniref:MFS domain-containing protein n=1 Tax=Angiostrongylus cantonensis TaxID=6313 RepID=A0A0K0DE66_ANGCA
MDEGTKRLDDYISMGRYVILVCVLAELMILPQVSSMYYMMYAGASPSLSACGDDLIFDPELDEKEVCRLYHHVALENCSAPSFRYEFKSVNVEWNYICENANIIKNSISVQMIGVLTGSVVFGQLSDLYGRRKVSGMAASLLLVAKSATLVQFTVTRTIVGFFTGGSIAVLNVFIMENIPKRHRMWINMVITWSPNIMPMALMAWLSAYWRTLAVANAATCVPGILFCLIWIKESPQWLLQRGRINEAIEIMRREFNCFKERDMNNVVEKEYYVGLY